MLVAPSRLRKRQRIERFIGPSEIPVASHE
jgi:hypothetical protein